MTSTIQLHHLFICPAHNFKGHKGGPPGETPNEDCDQVECIAGRGLAGDRYLDFKDNFKGQITFFSMEVLEEVCRQLGVDTVPPDTTRRNILVSGVDLNTLIGKEFEIQGVRFVGTEECRPCFWMNDVIAPEAEQTLMGRGGLRARILTDGFLKRGEGQLEVFDA